MTTTKRFIRAADLATLARGSDEERGQAVCRAIAAFEDDRRPLGEALEQPLAVVATFPSSVVVADAAGGIHTYVLSSADAGQVAVESRTPRSDVRTLAEEDLAGYRKQTLKRIAEDAAEGRPLSDDDVLALLR